MEFAPLKLGQRSLSAPLEAGEGVAPVNYNPFHRPRILGNDAATSALESPAARLFDSLSERRYSLYRNEHDQARDRYFLQAPEFQRHNQSERGSRSRSRSGRDTSRSSSSRPKRKRQRSVASEPGIRSNDIINIDQIIKVGALQRTQDTAVSSQEPKSGDEVLQSEGEDDGQGRKSVRFNDRIITIEPESSSESSDSIVSRPRRRRTSHPSALRSHIRRSPSRSDPRPRFLRRPTVSSLSSDEVNSTLASDFEDEDTELSSESESSVWSSSSSTSSFLGGRGAEIVFTEEARKPRSELIELLDIVSEALDSQDLDAALTEHDEELIRVERRKAYAFLESGPLSGTDPDPQKRCIERLRAAAGSLLIAYQGEADFKSFDGAKENGAPQANAESDHGASIDIDGLSAEKSPPLEQAVELPPVTVPVDGKQPGSQHDTPRSKAAKPGKLSEQRRFPGWTVFGDRSRSHRARYARRSSRDATLVSPYLGHSLGPQYGNATIVCQYDCEGNQHPSKGIHHFQGSFELSKTEASDLGSHSSRDENHTSIAQGKQSFDCHDFLQKASPLKTYGGVRLLYFANNLHAAKCLLNILAFPQRDYSTAFLNWLTSSSQSDAATASINQTFLWPCRDDFRRSVCYTGFGFDYIALSSVPNTTVPYQSGIGSVARTSNSLVLRRLSVCIQCRRATRPERDASPEVRNENFLIIHDTGVDETSSHGRFAPNLRKLRRSPLCNSIVRLDSEPIFSELLDTIFDGLKRTWEDYLYHMTVQVTHLQNLIYRDPANDALSSSLWDIAKQLTQAQRLLQLHLLLAQNIQLDILPSLDLPNPSGIQILLHELHRTETLLRSAIELPVTQMVDLMYKSISIRDARSSLQLNLSLWRLSWITFIFLPLTWLCGFFSMNVSVMEPKLSIGWYFVAAVPLMVLVMAAWLTTKKVLRPNVSGGRRGGSDTNVDGLKARYGS